MQRATSLLVILATLTGGCIQYHGAQGSGMELVAYEAAAFAYEAHSGPARHIGGVLFAEVPRSEVLEACPSLAEGCHKNLPDTSIVYYSDETEGADRWILLTHEVTHFFLDGDNGHTDGTAWEAARQAGIGMSMWAGDTVHPILLTSDLSLAKSVADHLTELYGPCH